jgi:uncharacterized protein (DUF1800 family)
MRSAARAARIVAVVTIVSAMPATARMAGQVTSSVPKNPDDRTIVHVLNRIGFGAAPGDLERVRSLGLSAYIDQQLHPERIDDSELATRLAAFDTLSKSTEEMATQFYLPAQMARRQLQRQQAQLPEEMTAAQREMSPDQAEAVRKERQALLQLMQAKVLRAAHSDRQLEEVMVDFWFNHFNVFSDKGQVRVYLNEYERDAIRPRVLGMFRELLRATAESPAMLFYLDNWQSSAAEGARTAAPRTEGARASRRNPNRMSQLNGGTTRPRTLADLPPGLRNRRAGLNENYARELMELHTLGVEGGYSQKDVQEVARAFTGWTIANPRQGGAFRFEARMHDDGEKVVLGHTIKAGGGKKDGDAVLDLLANHPSTARFIATKLARRFVADEPPQTLIDRAARRFTETGGNIREVVKSILTSPEFFAGDSYRVKVKTPFEFVVSAVRATGTDTNNAMPLVLAVRNLGMPLYGCQPPTGYSDKAEAWVNSGALLNRMNFAVSLTTSTSERRAARRSPQVRDSAGPTVTSDALVASALAGELSETTAATVAKATTPTQALALVLGSPEFQRK